MGNLFTSNPMPPRCSIDMKELITYRLFNFVCRHDKAKSFPSNTWYEVEKDTEFLKVEERLISCKSGMRSIESTKECL